MTMLFLLAALCVFVISAQVRFLSKRHRIAALTCEDVLRRFEPMSRDAIWQIAECHLAPSKTQLRLQPDDIWFLIGGMEGLEKLEHNASLLLDLGFIAQRWSADEAVVITERIRRDAVLFRSALRQIRIAFLIHGNTGYVPFHLVEAVASYYLMCQRILGLYQSLQVALVPQLEAAF